MKKISKERKIIILVGVLLIVIGGVYRFSSQIDLLMNENTQIALKKQKLEKLYALTQDRKVIDKRYNYLNRTIERAEFKLLSGGTSALGAVDIQNILNKIAGNIGIEITSTRINQPEKFQNPDYLGIGVRVTFESSINQLKKMLYEIETYPKYLCIKEIKTYTKHAGDLQIATDLTISGIMNLY